MNYEKAIEHANENRIELGYTNYCLDLWLILHKKDFFDIVGYQDDYAVEMKGAFQLSATANIKKSSVVEKIMEQIILENIKRYNGKSRCNRG